MSINQGIIASQFDYDALLFLNAAGITNSTQRLAINYLSTSLKLNGLWDKLNAIYPFVGGTATTHKFNLKNPLDTDAAFRLSFIGGWTHSTNGATPNGTNAYADTFLVPSVNLSLNSNSFGIYSRTNNTTGNQIYGSYRSGVTTLQNNIVYPGGTQGAFTSNNLVGFFYPIITTSFLMATRTSSTVFKGFRAGSLLGSNSTPTTSLPNLKFLFSARQETSATDIRWYNVHQLAFAFLGSGLTDAEALIFYNIVQTFQTTLGRQVV
jgi:hypothetical protein